MFVHSSWSWMHCREVLWLPFQLDNSTFMYRSVSNLYSAVLLRWRHLYIKLYLENDSLNKTELLKVECFYLLFTLMFLERQYHTLNLFMEDVYLMVDFHFLGDWNRSLKPTLCFITAAVLTDPYCAYLNVSLYFLYLKKKKCCQSLFL